MKIGFAVQVNNGLESAVYNHFGSAPAFIIVDTENNGINAINNSNVHHEHGSCNPVMVLENSSIDVMVVGGIGPGALMKLNAMKIRVFRSSAPTISENIALLEENKLEEFSIDASCQQHRGHCGH